MVESYHTVNGEGSGEIVEKKSRFIADIFPVSTEGDVSGILEKVKKRYWDARHHCWAYIIGGTDGGPPSERMSDDGEPAGTAGTQGQKPYKCTGGGHKIFRRHPPWDRRPCPGIYCRSG